MKQEKKLVLPGDHIGSAEEIIPGQNTYSENDEIYSSAFGELNEHERQMDVEKARHLPKPHVGMELYCVVRKISPTKAFLDCVPAAEMERRGSVIEISAVLPVQNIKSERVNEVKDELRTGDIIKAKISKMERGGVDASIYGPSYGVVKAFCTACRDEMVLKGGLLICSGCEGKERRKLSENYSLRE